MSVLLCVSSVADYESPKTVVEDVGPINTVSV